MNVAKQFYKPPHKIPLDLPVPSPVPHDIHVGVDHMEAQVVHVANRQDLLPRVQLPRHAAPFEVRGEVVHLEGGRES